MLLGSILTVVRLFMSNTKLVWQKSYQFKKRMRHMVGVRVWQCQTLTIYLSSTLSIQNPKLGIVNVSDLCKRSTGFESEAYRDERLKLNPVDRGAVRSLNFARCEFLLPVVGLHRHCLPIDR